ncbi:MAG: Fic/DOC family N-terminal domain-containing protein [Patescibacteria group bacterium]|nr:Fic/DOC family N-terminal domain-containing protein [Patescibacteria group bacterium]
MNKTFKLHKLPLENLNWIYFLENIGSANRALTKFDGTLKGIPNARVLLSPLTTNEAVLSSKIEGTQATLEEVLKFEANPKKKTEKYEDIQEIINYRKAMDMAINKLNELPLTERLIREIHKTLLIGVRGEGKDPGNFRTGEVFIGKKGLGIEGASYIPPKPQEIKTCFSDFEKYIHYDEKDVLVQLAIIHAQFEIIHPFWDGNGRTGRILMPLFLYYKKVLNTPMFYLSEYFEKNREEYYENLQGISKNNDWENWIKFFLVAVEKQSEINTQKVESILDLYNKTKEKIIDIPTPKNSIKVLDFIFSMPIFDSGDFRRHTRIKENASFRILKFLSDEKILSDDKKSQNRTYFFDNLIKIIM